MSITAVLFALVLALSSATAWLVAGKARASARLYVRFASVLYLALAVAGLMPDGGEPTGEFARAVALVVCVLAPCLLCVALIAEFAKPLPTAAAALFLALACLGGVAAAATDATALGFVPLALACVLCGFVSLRALRRARVAALQGLASALAFLCAASALMAGGEAARPALDLFSAVGILGAALALVRGLNAGVEQERRRNLSRVLRVGDER